MKRITIITALLFITAGFTGCITDPNEEIREKVKNDKDFVTMVEWPVIEKNLGTIEEGQKMEVIFEYKNTGTKPLVIKNVHATCGCTVPEIPKEPVMPGKSGYIKAIFNSDGRAGENHKSITVYSNSKPGEQKLDFSVNVMAKPQKST